MSFWSDFIRDRSFCCCKEVKEISKNIGKIFEENFKKSVPSDVWYYRPPDSAQSFGSNSNLRFSVKSPCDCFMFDGEKLYTLELKSVGTISISFEKNKEDKGVIHKHQIDKLLEFSRYENIISGFLFDFRLNRERTLVTLVMSKRTFTK